jgi:hypothetical protein
MKEARYFGRPFQNPAILGIPLNDFVQCLLFLIVIDVDGLIWVGAPRLS